MHGTGARRRRVRFYGCTTRDRRGPTTCANATLLRHEILDRAFLDAIRASLDEDLLREVVARAVARRLELQGSAHKRRPAVARELQSVEQRIARLVDAITSAGLVEELLDRLRAERARKASLVEELRTLAGPEAGRGSDLQARVTAIATDLRRHLGVQIDRTRQLLAAILSGPVSMTPIVESQRRGYRFSGRLRLDGPSLAGEGVETSHLVVAPTGFGRQTCSLSSRSKGKRQYPERDSTG